MQYLFFQTRPFSSDKDVHGESAFLSMISSTVLLHFHVLYPSIMLNARPV